MSPYRSLMPTDRPTAFGNLLTPMAEGFASGLNEDRLRRRNLEDQVTAYRSLMPYQMETFQKQHEILGKMQEQRDAAALTRALLLKRIEQESPEQQARTQLANLVQQPISETRPAGSPFPQEGSGEAMAGPEAWTGRTSVATTSPGVSPNLLASLAIQAKYEPKDLQSILRLNRGTTGPSTPPPASPGMRWGRTVNKEGEVSYAEHPIPADKPPILDKIPDSLALDVAGGALPSQKLPDGTILDAPIAQKIVEARGLRPKEPPKPPSQANSPEAVMGEMYPGKSWDKLTDVERQAVNKEANRRGLEATRERGKGFAYSRAIDLMDTATGRPTKMSLGEYLEREEKFPGRYMPLSAQAAPFYPSDIAEKQARYMASVGELRQLQAQRGKIMAFVNTTEKNLGLVEEISGKVDRTGIPVINRWLMAGKKSLAGDPDVSQLDAAMRTAINEYARVTSSATGGGVTSDAARREIEDMLNTAQTKEQVRAVITLLRREMGNRQAGYEKQIQEITGNIRGGGPSQVGQPTKENTIPAPPNPERPRNLKVNGVLRYWDGTSWQNPR